MGKQRRFWFDLLQEKRQILRSDKDVERLDDNREARAEGGRRFQRAGAYFQLCFAFDAFLLHTL